jgi:hypothetical protein
MRTIGIAFVSLVSACVLSACDNNSSSGSTATSPTGVETMAVGVAASTLSAQTVRNAVCPSLPPFNVPVNLLVRAGAVPLSLTQVTMRFRDAFDVSMPPVTLPAPVLTRQFGSLLVEARSERNFPLSIGLGCGTGHTGTLVIVIDTRDALGGMSSQQVVATVM